jgi:hypothetical protein
MSVLIVVRTLLTLRVATYPGPGRSASFPEPASITRAGVTSAALPRSRRDAGRHWRAQ